MLTFVPALTLAADPEPAARHRHVSFTLSVADLPGVATEVRVTDRFSLGGAGGLWVYPAGPLVLAALQARAYPIGSFDHGLSLAIEATMTWFPTQPLEPQISGSGVPRISPLVGYKVATRSGFTFDIQLGVAIPSRRPDPLSRVRVVGAGHLGVGWSF